MVELVGIEYNIAKMAQLISRTWGHPNPVKITSDRKTSHWNHTQGHLCLTEPLPRSAHFVVHDSDYLSILLKVDVA